MKKWSYLVIIFWFLIHSNEAKSQPLLTWKFGSNISKIEGGIKQYNTEYQLGMHAGISSVFHITRHLRLRPELLVVEKGGKIVYHFETYRGIGDISGIQRVNYLVLPLNVDFVLPLKDEAALFFGSGVFIGRGISGKAEYKNVFRPHADPTQVQTFTAKHDMYFGDYQKGTSYYAEYGSVRRYDGGVLFSTGYQKGRAIVEVAYAHGLVNINPINGYAFASQSEKFSRSVSLSLAWAWFRKDSPTKL